MKKNVCVPLIVLLFLTVGFVAEAGAIGMGVYFDSISGSKEWDVDREVDDDEYTDEWDTDKTTTGFGFVMDTTLARDNLFNYRFQIGLEKAEIDIEDWGTAELTGVAMTHDFGFGVVRTSNVRVWFGPELRFAVLSGDVDVDEGPGEDIDWDIALFNYGIGPVLGVNFNIGPTATLAVKTGILWEGMVGAGDVDYSGLLTDWSADDDYSASDTVVFINFAILFRMADKY